MNDSRTRKLVNRKRRVQLRLWHRELGVGHSAIVYDGGVLYAMYREDIDDADERVVALDARTGKEVWEHVANAPPVNSPDRRWGGQEPNSTPPLVGDRLFVLDENGHLGLATVTNKRMTVHSDCQISERYSLTAPTLVGTTLYVRDRKHIMALDLGARPGVEQVTLR